MKRSSSTFISAHAILAHYGVASAGPHRFEAGFVYRLTSRQRKQVLGLLTFAGPATEVQSGKAPTTVQPSSEEEKSVPRFLSEVVASGPIVTVRFRETIPADLVLLMPVPARTGDSCFWLLYPTQAKSGLVLIA
jgi:hypothetical protein